MKILLVIKFILMVITQIFFGFEKFVHFDYKSKLVPLCCHNLIKNKKKKTIYENLMYLTKNLNYLL